MVEDHQGVEAGEDGDGESEGIGRAVRQALHHAEQVVAEVAHEAAGERNGARLGADLVDHLAQGLQRLAGEVLAFAAALHLQAVGVEAVDRPRRRPQEAEAGDPLAAGHALEQEAVGGEGGQPPVDGERRQAVREELPDMGDGTARPARSGRR